MLRKRSLLSLILGLAVSGCVQPEAARRWAQMAPAERQAALEKVTVSPAGVSTVEFKEMGDTARTRVLTGLIRRAWGQSCDVAVIEPAGYFADGHSRWRARCGTTVAAVGYLVALPEKASQNARVWQCNRTGLSGPQAIHCSVLSQPTGAGS